MADQTNVSTGGLRDGSNLLRTTGEVATNTGRDLKAAVDRVGLTTALDDELSQVYREQHQAGIDSAMVLFQGLADLINVRSGDVNNTAKKFDETSENNANAANKFTDSVNSAIRA